MALVAIVAVCNAPLLDELAGLVQSQVLAASSDDAATHFVRMLHARDYYLPSGHRWGWDPFWFQGYVPFLLYPHLTYVLLASISLALPVDPARLFNVYTAFLYVALPLTAAFTVRRSLGWPAAAVAASWFSLLSTFGAGMKGVFQIGLLAQQAGVIVFVAFAHDVLIARRVDRAAIWLGLLSLVHVHATIIAGVAWLVVGALSLREHRGETRAWLTGSLVAGLVSMPTVAGLLHGWSGRGRRSSFGERLDPLDAVLNGTLVAPAASVAAILLCVLFAVLVTSGESRRRHLVWTGFSAFLLVVSFHKWTVGVELLDDLSTSVLYLRTLPFAFVWLALLAVVNWTRLPRRVRSLTVALSMVGVVSGWPLQMRVDQTIGMPTPRGKPVAPGYLAALEWIAKDARGETTTLAVPVMRPMGIALMLAEQTTGLPLLNGHGAELTSIHNAGFVNRVEEIDCERIARNLGFYAVGYVVGSSGIQRARLEKCLGTKAAFDVGQWWVVATGHSWRSVVDDADGFESDATWTELRWHLRRSAFPKTVRLPVAYSPSWSADVDGEPVRIEATGDRMMRLDVPGRSNVLRLHYDGYAGEWTTVAVALAALAFAIVRIRRRSAAGANASADTGR